MQEEVIDYMTTSNPFSLTYGKTPKSIVERLTDASEIINDFSAEESPNMAYIITGLRGTGKTVLLRSLARHFDEREDWMVIDINPQSDIFSSFSAKLLDAENKHKVVLDWSLSFNLPYVSLSVSKGKEVIDDPEIIAERLINEAHRKHKKILITIDEVAKTQSFKMFVNFYQAIIDKGYPVFMLMTGIRDNIDQLVSDSAMTFLSRCPKVELGPLNMPSISYKYQEILSVNEKLAFELAKLTNGYAFAYQVLGYLLFEKEDKNITTSLLNDYDKYLAENGYNTFWKELTGVEKQICVSVAKSKDGDVSEIKQNSEMTQNNFNNYRARLIRKEIIVAKAYGKLDFTLPRFREYVLMAEQYGY